MRLIDSCNPTDRRDTLLARCINESITKTAEVLEIPELEAEDALLEISDRFTSVRHLTQDSQLK